MSNSPAFLDIPQDILVTLPDYLHDIEDYKNLTSTCRTLRVYLSATPAKTILRLTAAASSTFFRPSPFFLVASVARQLGNWARASSCNEQVLARTFQGGIDAVLDLCLEHCGLTMERIRQLHAMKFSVINPVTDIIDKCIGEQWYATPDFWNGGVDDAYTIDADPPETLFHLAVYGELFGPDFDLILDGQGTDRRPLTVDTRLEYVKYCIPDWACYECQETARDVVDEDGSIDPRRLVLGTGPYEELAKREGHPTIHGSQIGLKHLLASSRWNPHWDTVRKAIGPDFTPLDDYITDFNGWELVQWKQLLWKSVILSQGLDGLAMISVGPGALEARLSSLREKIESLKEDPEMVHVGRNFTMKWPYLEGDLSICSSGYVLGT